MSLDATRWAWKQDVRPMAKLVLLALADRADKAGSNCYPSVGRIEKDTRLSRRAVINLLEELETGGVIQVAKSRGRANRYNLILHPELVHDVHQLGEGESGQLVHDMHPTRAPRAPELVHDVHPNLPITVNEPKNTGRRKPAPIFCVPTIDEVNSFCRERGNQVDAEEFVAYYTSNGWKVGRGPMQDWRAAVVTWEKRQRARAKGNGSASRTSRVASRLDEIIRDGLPEEQGRVSNSDPFIEGEYTRGNHEER